MTNASWAHWSDLNTNRLKQCSLLLTSNNDIVQRNNGRVCAHTSGIHHVCRPSLLFCIIYSFTGLFKSIHFHIRPVCLWKYLIPQLALWPSWALNSHSNLNKAAFITCSLCGEMTRPPLIQMKYYLSSEPHHRVSGPAYNGDWSSGCCLLPEGSSSSNWNWNVPINLPRRQYLM